MVTGPTAVGKTSFAIELARQLNTEIISADSRQCYRELNIGVARPSLKELALVPHHFIASHSVSEDVNAKTFEDYALAVAGQIFQDHESAVMAGGTGLYIKAFEEGMDLIPEISDNTRSQIRAGYAEHGREWLHSELLKKDPLFSEKGEMQNPARMMRALEVITDTGRSILHFRGKKPITRKFRIKKYGLHISKESLHRNIETRVENMFTEGLLEEAHALIPFRHLKALQTVGYQELFDYFDGNIPIDRAKELIRQNTRQYAKRQLTWFKRDKSITWLDIEKEDKAKLLEKVLNDYRTP